MSILSITIFGSTGGTGLAFLRLWLQASLPITVLVRSEAKLLNLLSVSTAPINLHIVTGSSTDYSAVKAALLTKSGQPTNLIFSSVGVTPDLTLSGLWSGPFKNANQTLCEDTAKAIMKELRPEQLFVAISTTGISDLGRDIPIAMVPLYHGMLKVPHADKKTMERVIMEKGEGRRWVIVRASFLVGDGLGGGKGVQKLRIGVERNGKSESSEMGYTVYREDVGRWVFEELVKKGEKNWEGAIVSLTN